MRFFLGEITDFYPVKEISAQFQMKKKRLFYHISFWIAYVLFKSYMQVDTGQPLSTNMILTTVGGQLMFLLVKIPMVYALFYIIGKYIGRQWNVGKTILCILALFVVGLVLFMPVKQYMVLGWIYGIDAPLSAAFGLTSILSTLFILGFVCAVAVAVKLIRLNLLQRELQQETVKRKLETELQYLKAQINPHFLFNTLNNIYALTRKKSDKAPEVVLKLSKLFRFILYEAQRPYISIAEEIQVLENYIELEKIRYNEKLKIDFVCTVDDRSQSIAPLILLPLVENAFKHGASESRFNSYIHIDLKVDKGWLYFQCENSKADEVHNSDKGKIGLENIRRQLELVYADHSLRISNETDVFRVFLEVDLNKQGPSAI
jgi:two-component system, LytTR family, sensor kinase